MSSNSDHFWAEKGSFWPPESSFFENSIFEVLFLRFSVFLENMRILIDSKATKCRNNVDFGSKKLDFWNSQEYRFFELEIHHYSFLLEFVEFLDEMKTPEIKKNMKFGHHSVHPSIPELQLLKSWTSQNDLSLNCSILFSVVCIILFFIVLR